jgi:hypothetical protein
VPSSSLALGSSVVRGASARITRVAGSSSLFGQANRRKRSAPGMIRTCDLCLRRAALYPLSYGRGGSSVAAGLEFRAMRVTFRKTGLRRYGVWVERERGPALMGDPAPGFDEFLPHDLLHFVAEAEWGLDGAVFGPLAAGDAGSFWPVDQALVRKAMRRRRRRGSGRAADVRNYSPGFSSGRGTRSTGAARCRRTGSSSSRPLGPSPQTSSASSRRSTSSPSAGSRCTSASR